MTFLLGTPPSSLSIFNTDVYKLLKEDGFEFESAAAMLKMPHHPNSTHNLIPSQAPPLAPHTTFRNLKRRLHLLENV